MPNWAMTQLVITGHEDDIHKFVYTLESKRGETEKGNPRWSIMATFLPCPHALQAIGNSRSRKSWEEGPEHDTPAEAENRKRYGYVDWYERNIAVWGCKWCDVVEVMKDSPNRIELYLESPWSPPLRGLAQVFAMFPSFRAELSWCDECVGEDSLCRWDGTQWIQSDAQGLLPNWEDLTHPDFNAEADRHEPMPEELNDPSWNA